MKYNCLLAVKTANSFLFIQRNHSQVDNLTKRDQQIIREEWQSTKQTILPNNIDHCSSRRSFDFCLGRWEVSIGEVPTCFFIIWFFTCCNAYSNLSRFSLMFYSVLSTQARRWITEDWSKWFKFLFCSVFFLSVPKFGKIIYEKHSTYRYIYIHTFTTKNFVKIQLLAAAEMYFSDY